MNRSTDPEAGAFGIGDNDIAIWWDSLTGRATVRIPSPAASGVDLSEDLLLFVAVSEAWLMNTRAYVVDRFELKRSVLRSAAAPLFAVLRREIGGSRVENPLKSRLLGIVDGAETDLALGQNVHARKALLEQLVPLLRRNSGKQGLSATQAGEWIAEAQKLVSKIPLD